MYVLVRAANPFIGTTVGVAVCLLIVAFLMAVATGKAKRRRRADTTPGECLRHHHSSSGATGLPGPQVGFRRLGVSPQWRFFSTQTAGNRWTKIHRTDVVREAQLSPRDRAMRRVH